MGNVCLGGTRKQLNAAVVSGDDQKVEEILKRRPDIVAHRTLSETGTALHHAAASGDLKMCQLLVDETQAYYSTSTKLQHSHPKAATDRSTTTVHRCLNRKDAGHNTPLMIACKHGHAPVVRYLLQQGADPFVQDKPRGYYCLHIAAYHGHVDVLHVLLDPATRVERNGRRIPLSAAKVQYTGGTCRFIDSRAALGMTAMHLAAIKGKAGVAAVLLQRGASMAVRTVGQDALDGVPITLGATPLHLAAKCGSMDTLQAMLQAYVDGMGTPSWKHGDRRVDLRRVRDCTRALPYHTAARTGHRQAAELLDPRVALELALDNCRDTSVGIGPQRLSTMAARLLRWQHVTWLDGAERVVEQEARAAASRGIQRSLSEPVRADHLGGVVAGAGACAAIAEDEDVGATSSAKLGDEEEESVGGGDWGGGDAESGWMSSESSSGPGPAADVGTPPLVDRVQLKEELRSFSNSLRTPTEPVHSPEEEAGVAEVLAASTGLQECSICVMATAYVMVDECNHSMCESPKEVICPWCRRIVGGFHLAQRTGAP